MPFDERAVLTEHAEAAERRDGGGKITACRYADDAAARKIDTARSIISCRVTLAMRVEAGGRCAMLFISLKHRNAAASFIRTPSCRDILGR